MLLSILFYIVLIVGLIYSLRISGWARQTRMGYDWLVPLIFTSYPKVFYVSRWIFILGFTGLTLVKQINFPLWLVPLLFVISVWIGRQFGAFQLSRHFRWMYRNGEIINDPETGEPLTPEELLKSAYENEKMSVWGWRYMKRL